MSNVKRNAVNAFLLFHVVAISCWCLPINNRLILRSRNWLRPYMVWSGLFQSWDMFAPIPKMANTGVAAIIEYKNGSTEFWTFPRLLAKCSHYPQLQTNGGSHLSAFRQ